MGIPFESSIVTVPRGLVLCELANDAGGVNDAPDTESAELIVEAGVRFSWLISDVIDLSEVIEPFFLGSSLGVSSETIFMPTVVPVEAGMKSVVIPRFLITVR